MAARHKSVETKYMEERDAAASNGDKGRGPGLAGPFGDIGPAQSQENPALLGGD